MNFGGSVERERMVDEQIKARGIGDQRVIRAMLEAPRHRFAADSQRIYAYDDRPLPIGQGQTISQPYIVAFMIEALQTNPADRVLEIGTGSGYAAAVLSRVVSRVYSIETIKALADRAREVIEELKYDSIYLRIGDGTKGWPEEAPFDGILVSAGAPVAPESLIAQLAPGGRLVIPVGDKAQQVLLRITRRPDGRLVQEELAAVRFVPLVGEEGWS